MKPRQRRSYTPEFKAEAIEMAKQRGTADTARSLDLSPSLLRTWQRKLEAEGARAFPGKGNPRDAELADLQRRLRRSEEENAILKKAVGIFTSRPQ